MKMDIASEILACERKRCDALLAGDMTMLAELLSDDLMFVHANATTDTKDSLLAKMRTGSIVYQSLAIDQDGVTAIGDHAALLTARLTADLLVRGEPKRVSNLFLSVWAQEDGRWRLLAYQPTPLPN